jgi:hypothetical protein
MRRPRSRWPPSRSSCSASGAPTTGALRPSSGYRARCSSVHSLSPRSRPARCGGGSRRPRWLPLSSPRMPSGASPRSAGRRFEATPGTAQIARSFTRWSSDCSSVFRSGARRDSRSCRPGRSRLPGSVWSTSCGPPPPLLRTASSSSEGSPCRSPTRMRTRRRSVWRSCRCRSSARAARHPLPSGSPPWLPRRPSSSCSFSARAAAPQSRSCSRSAPTSSSAETSSAPCPCWS